MNKRRLRDLVKVLRGVKPRNFRMDQWACGTTMCAAGHYMKAYPRRGMRPLKQNGAPTIGEAHGLWALAIHFDIPASDAGDLFYPSHLHRTKRQVIRHLEKYISTGVFPALTHGG